MSTMVPSPAHGLNILVVEDHEALLTVMADFLEGAGHNVRTAPSGTLAFYRLFHEKPQPAVDLVITDLQMKGLDGLDLHRIVALREPALASRFIFVTGHAGAADELEELEQAGIPVITKPFALGTLTDAIRKVATRARG